MNRIANKKIEVMKKSCLFSLIGVSVCVLLALVACTQDYLSSTRSGSGGVAEVNFTVTIPTRKPLPAMTRADVSEDSEIRTMDLLVFDENGKFVERCEAENIELIEDLGNGEASYSFSAWLNQVEDEDRTVYFIANARDYATNADRVDFSFCTPGEEDFLVIQSMKTIPLNRPVEQSDLLPLIMWGKLPVLHGVGPEQSVGGIKLLRVTAAFQVKEADLQTTENGLADFEIIKYSAGNSAGDTSVAPELWDAWTNDSGIPNEAVLGMPMALVNHFSTSTTGYWTVAEGFHYMNEIYSNPDTYIMIEARYKGELCYYKLRKNGPSSSYGDWVRNHRYIMNIVSVNGPGFASISEAVHSDRFSNHEIVAHFDEFDELTTFVSDGRHYMGLSGNDIRIVKFGTANITFELAKVHMTRDYRYATVIFSGTGLSNIAISEPTPENNWLSTITANVSATSGSGTITISDGVFSLPIHVTISSPEMGTVSGSSSFGGGNVMPLLGSAPWSLEILEGSRNVFLSLTGAGSALPDNPPSSGTNWGTWGQTYISDQTPGLNGEVWLVLCKTAAAGFNGVIRYSSMVDGQLVVGLWVCGG